MQTIFCTFCGAENSSYAKHCQRCRKPLLKPSPEIARIREELLKLREVYDKRFTVLMDKLLQVEATDKKRMDDFVRELDILRAEKVNLPQTDERDEIAKEQDEEKKPEIVKKAEPENKKQQVFASSPTEAVQPVPDNKKKRLEEARQMHLQKLEQERKQAEQKRAEQKKLEEELRERKKQRELAIKEERELREKKRQEAKAKLKQQVDAIGVTSFFMDVFAAPLADMSAFFVKTYNRYKEKNQLPVFFMTLAGIAALLFGFGYLMQLSVSYLGEIGELLKVAVGFVSSSGIAWWATVLGRKHKRYGDFSSALLGLSVSLNYVFIYFLVDMNAFGLFAGSVAGFAAIFLNTVWAVFLALRYETKIVAVLSLLGGAFAPMYLSTSGNSLAYFAYLWILSASSIFVAYRIKWKILGVLAFITTTGIVELALLNNQISLPRGIMLIFAHAFAYLFMWISLFDGRKMVEKLDKTAIVLLAGNMSVLLFNLFYLFDGSEQIFTLGLLYVGNALFFFPGLWLLQRRANKQMRLLLLVIAGTFVAFALPAMFDTNLLGLFWSIEALALVFLGYNFALPNVRKEGYLLLLIALGKIALTFDSLWFLSANTGLLTSGFYNLLSLGAVFGAFALLLFKNKEVNAAHENTILLATREAIVFWFVASYLCVVSYFTTTEIAFATAPLAIVIVLFAKHQKLVYSKVLGYVLFVGAIAYSAFFAINFIPVQWHTHLFATGYYNLLGIGAFLLLLQLAVYLSFKKTEKNIAISMRRLSELVSVWFVITLLVTTAYFAINFVAFFTVVCSLVYLYWGKKQSQNIKQLGYVVFVAGISYAVFMATNSIADHFGTARLFSSVGFVNLLAIGLFLGAMVQAQIRLFDREDKKVVKFVRVNWELLALWFTVLYVSVGFATVGNYTSNLAILPMFGLIYWGNKRKFALTEGIGILFVALLLGGYLLSVAEVGSYRISLQNLSGKIAIVEFLFCMWFIKYFYEKIGGNKLKTKNADVVREVFYWIVPLILISVTHRNAPDFFATGIWGAVLINFVLFEITKRESLLIQFYMLVVAAVGFSYFALNPLIPLGTSLLVLGAVYARKKAFSRSTCYATPFKYLFVLGHYYLGAAIFILTEKVLGSTTDALAVVATYLTVLVLLRKQLVPLRNNFLLAFWLAVVGVGYGLLLRFPERETALHFLTILPIVPLFVLLYSKWTIYPRKQKANWITALVVLHFLFAGSYALVLKESALTIAIIVHAILLLFNSMRDFSRPLIWQSILLFAVAVVKLYFWDIAHFSMPQKVIVFIVIGVLLILASYLYVKLKERFDK